VALLPLAISLEPHEAFSAARMTRFQGLLPQHLKGLMPTLGIDLQHGSSHSMGLGDLTQFKKSIPKTPAFKMDEVYITRNLG
jgi:hypothetical protein